MARLLILLFLLVAGPAQSAASSAADAGTAATASFNRLLTQLAAAWTAGDARAAADLFTEDAIYVQPPGRQLRRGRESLFRFFGGPSGRPGAMTMVWHRIAFDPAASVGFGEFSFVYGTQAHGVAVVRMRDGRIAEWREYWVESALPFPAFVAPTKP